MRVPLLTLLVILGAAALALFGGERLARRHVQERQPVNRALANEFGGLLQEELFRLEQLYEEDLNEVGQAVHFSEPFASRQMCETLYGIRQCYFVPLFVDAGITSLSISGSNGKARPPDLGKESRKPFQQHERAFVLTSSGLKNPPETSMRAGWLKSPDPTFAAFWMAQGPNRAVVLVVDRNEVIERTNQHLAEWVAAPHAALRAAGDLHRVEGPAPLASALASSSTIPERLPDFVLPLHSRLGIWQIIGWDRTFERVEYDVATLVVSGVVALLLAGFGIILFRQQIHAHRVAEQRVSFVNSVSHEFGTPLTNILLNLDLAKESIQSQPHYSRERLGLVSEEVQRLARLVTNVLTFSRSEGGVLKLNNTTCVPDEVINNVMQQFEPALARRSIEVEFSAAASVGVVLDPDALSQIIGNLISNVEKYAAAGGWLGLESHMSGDELVVRVADRGPGIQDPYRKLVFEPFQRVSSSLSEGASGTGLGLSIAVDLASRQHGTLKLIESVRGAVFELRLPVRRVIIPLPGQRSVA